MGIFFAQILIKLVGFIPDSVLIKIGYSKIGSKIIKIIKKRQSSRIVDIGNGIKMYLDLTNPHTWDLAQGKEDEKKTKEIFLNNIKDGDTVIDVGANVGEYSLIASKSGTRWQNCFNRTVKRISCMG